MQFFQRSRFFFIFALFCVSIFLVAGCGGGSSAATTTSAPTSIAVNPSILSMTAGQVVQVSAQLLDANGASISSANYAYSSTGGVQVSTAGLVCAGTWDSLTSPVICTPGPVNGTGVVTVTASGISQTINATIHTRISRITISTTPPALCNSQTETQQFTAQAFDVSGNNITAQVGAFFYTSSNPASVSVDANGLAKAVQPGGAFITASSNGVFSVPATFNSCQPLSIVLSPATAVSIAVGATQTLTATVTDIKGNPITATGLALTYLSSSPATATVNSGGVITAVGAGSTGVVAACTPPTCNGGANANVPVYSNLVPVTVTGTSATTIYATGATATSIIPIDSGSNTAGTAITIPQVNSKQPIINSFVFYQAGNAAYLGSDQSLLLLDPTGKAVTAATAHLSGKVLAVSPNNTEVIYADQSGTPKTYVYNVASGTFTTLAIPTSTTAAAFSPDGLKAFLISGGNLWIYSAALAPPLIRQPSIPVTGANDATFLSQGSLGYLAGGASNAVTAFATCDNSLVATIAVPATPLKIASSFDSKHVFAVDGVNIDDITVSNIGNPPNQNCPATVTNSPASFNFGIGTFTPDQLIVTSDGSNVFVTTPTNKLLRYVTATNATSTITLASGTAITTGGATLDGKSVYLGATGTNDVHLIDVTSGTDTKQITVSLKDASNAAVSPDFVAVQPK